MLKVQFAYLIDIAQFLLQSALHFTFWHSILVLRYMGIIFSRTSSCSLVVYLLLLI